MSEIDVLAALEAATLVVDADSSLPVARFALYPAVGSDRARLRSQIVAALARFSPQVDDFSPLDTLVLVLTLPGRVMRNDAGAAFDAAYELAAAFGLVSAEPELHTDLYPEQDTPAGDEGKEELPDWARTCWAPPDSRLNENKAWALDRANVRAAWSFSAEQGKPAKGAGVIIAQPDTGITAHPELASIPLVAPRDLIAGKDSAQDPLDYLGNPAHGTGTGSVAVSREAGEVLGAAPGASHMPIRAIESVVRISQLRVAEAIDHAIGHGAHVITMSLGGAPSMALWRAIERAVKRDVIVLAAAGNCARLVVWPARYDNCIAVAGVNVDDAPWRGTCRGPDVDISAPGENVYRATTSIDNGRPVYGAGQGQGTSFAVALTAGVAALWLAHHGRDTIVTAARARQETVQAMFRRLVRATARRPAAGWDDTEMGQGIVDARALLAASFDLGAEDEAFADSISTPTDGIRRLVFEAADETATDIDANLERYGVEIAFTLLQQARGSRLTGGLEAAEMPVYAEPLSRHLYRVSRATPALDKLLVRK